MELIKGKDTLFNKIEGVPGPLIKGSSIIVYDWRQIRLEDVIDVSIDLLIPPFSPLRNRVKPEDIQNIEHEFVVIAMFLKGYRYVWHINDEKKKIPEGYKFYRDLIIKIPGYPNNQGCNASYNNINGIIP